MDKDDLRTTVYQMSARLAALETEVRMMGELQLERDLRYSQRFEAEQKARELYSSNEIEWRQETNKWRETMNDKDRNFVTTKALWGYILSAILIAVAITRVLLVGLQY